MDPVTGAVGAAASAVGKADRVNKDGLIARVFGPSADVLGEALAQMTSARVENMSRINEAADRKLPPDAGTGAVPMKVIGRLVEEGTYCDDTVAVDYLGGVLASSRQSSDRDDRGAKWASVIAGLSSYELRLHYLCYAAARQCFLAAGLTEVNVGHISEARSLLVRGEDLGDSMDFTESEYAAGGSLIRSSLVPMEAAGLISRLAIMRGESFQGEFSPPLEKDGWYVRFAPTVMGVALFLWGQGLGHEREVAFTTPSTQIEPIPGVVVPVARFERPPEAKSPD